MSYIMVRRVDSGCVLKVQLHVVARHKRRGFCFSTSYMLLG